MVVGGCVLKPILVFTFYEAEQLNLVIELKAEVFKPKYGMKLEAK